MSMGFTPKRTLVQFLRRCTAIDQIEVLPHAAKKTDVLGEATPAQIAWLYRVKQIAQQTSVGNTRLPQ